MTQHAGIGKEFQVVLHLPSVKPGKWIEPLDDKRDLRQQNVQGVTASHLYLFMDKDLIVGFPIIVLGIDKNGVAKRAGRPVATDLYDAETTILYHRPCIGL